MTCGLLNMRVAYHAGGDPMYAYLLNGLTLANGETDIGHTDNPGTTTQVFTAVVIRSVFLFSKSDDITSDVIADPEKYIFIARWVQILLISFSLFWLGYKVYKWDSNTFGAALLLQNCVLIGTSTFIHSHFLAPEGFLIMGGIMMLLLCANTLLKKDSAVTSQNRNAILFGIICGFMVVTKLPGLVYVIIPLFVLNGMRSKLVFAASFIVSAFLFVLPAIRHIHNLFDFAKNVATHSGKYGSGESKMLDANTFFFNLRQHLSNEWLLFAILLIASAMLVWTRLKYKNIYEVNKTEIRMLSGLILCVLANLFLATKHFGEHYLIPSHILLVLMLYVSISLYTKMRGHSPRMHPTMKIILLGMLLPGMLLAKFSARVPHFTEIIPQNSEAHKILFDDKNLPRIYVTADQKGAGPEPAFSFGYFYTGDARYIYGEAIRKQYPGAFVFDKGSGNFHDFANVVTPECIATRYPELWFYINGDTAIAGQQRLRFLSICDSAGPVVKFTKQFSSADGNEVIYLMQCDTSRARKCFKNTRDFVFDFENPTSDGSFLSSDSSCRLMAEISPVTTKALSGTKSLYFPHANVFTGESEFAVVPGAVYEISGWKYGEKTLCWIVAAAGPGNEYYQSGSAVTGAEQKGWKEVMLRVVVPVDFPYPTMRISLYDDDHHEREMWLDDFTVKEFQR